MDFGNAVLHVFFRLTGLARKGHLDAADDSIRLQFAHLLAVKEVCFRAATEKDHAFTHGNAIGLDLFHGPGGNPAWGGSKCPVQSK